MSTGTNYTIPTYCVLTKSEEIELFTAYFDNDKPIELRDKIINHNMRFVIKIATSFSRKYTYVPLNDIIGYGTLGLIHAIDKHDLSLKLKFITGAVWWIRNFIGKSIGENETFINVPNKQQEQAWRVIKSIMDGSYDGEDEDNDLIEANMLLSSVRSPISLDTPIEIGDDVGGTLMDTIIDDDFQFGVCPADDNDTVNAIEAIKDKLTDREFYIMSLKYGLDGGGYRANNMIGSIIGLTPEGTRLCIMKSLAKLRKMSNPCISELYQKSA
jgi:RNA polymerase sigma factor (sigma-70 family)